jgi:integrase
MPRKKEGRGAQGAGTIRQRKNGLWEARYTMGRDPGTGKQVQKSVYGKTQGEVRQKLAKISVSIDDGVYTDPSRLKVAEWLEIWQKDFMNGIKPATIATYKRQIKNHIAPGLGSARLQSLKPHQIQNFYNGLSATLSPKTVKNIHGVLHQALSKAVDLGYIPNNPADVCTLPKVQKFVIHPLDQEQIPAFIEASKGDPFHDLFVVDLFTGLRMSEIIGLTWDCIDQDTGTIYVYRQYQPLKGGYVWGTPKNGKARTIAPAKAVMQRLKAIRAEQIERRLAAGSAWRNEEDFVFTDAVGDHMKQKTIDRHFKWIAEKIGMPELRFHDLRHSFAVASLQAGDDIKTVQENLGHHSAAFTMDTYAHVTDAMRKNSSERMELYIKNTLNDTL